MTTIQVSEALYQQLVSQAKAKNTSPETLAESILADELFPNHPHIEIIQGTGGPRPVVKGSRVGVEVIVQYMQAGYSPQDVANELLPHLTLAQVYGALSYYEDHRPELDDSLAENTPTRWQKRLAKQLSPTDLARLLGDNLEPN
jgi:uncharacterized protein (DUF433 family)